MRPVIVLGLFAAACFFVLFSPWTKETISFWTMMPLATGSLAAASLYLDRRRLRSVYRFKPWHVFAGVLSAMLLYAIFWIGHAVSTWILPFAASQVNSIYTIRAEQNPWLIAGLLLFVIGPAEEIFWRGFIQRRLAEKYGIVAGLLLASAIYAMVHVWSFNLMLIAAAAVCGFFWGLLFALTGRLWPCIISHAIWDLVIFILLPIR